jgi:hypothetical protein
VDDEEDEENKKLAEKPRLVIVGGGWGVSRVHNFAYETVLIVLLGNGNTQSSICGRLPRNSSVFRDVHDIHASATLYVLFSPLILFIYHEQLLPSGRFKCALS